MEVDRAERSGEIMLTLPGNFEPDEVLSVRLRKRGDDARWLVSTVARKMAYRATDEYGYARLHSAVLRRVMSKRAQPAVVQALVDADVLDPLAPYWAGVKSKGYRLGEEYLTERFKLVPAKNPQLIKRMRREWERMRREQQQRWLPVDNELKRIHGGVTVHPSADVILSGLEPESQFLQRLLIEDIKRRNFRYSVSRTGRRFHFATGLKRELRKAILLEGEPIAGVDIRCCQPALLAVLIRLSQAKNVPTYILGLVARLADGRRSVASERVRWVRGSGLLGLESACSISSPALGSDFGSFEDLVLRGEFYEALVDLCSADGVPLAGSSRADSPRNRVKKLVLQEVLAKTRELSESF